MMELNKDFYTTKEIMKMFNVRNYRTVRLWEAKGFLVPLKNPTGKYMYPKEEILRYIALCKENNQK